MDFQFKKRVQARQQSESGQSSSATASAEHSAARNNHTLPSHHPGLLSPTSARGAQTGRTTGGAIRTTTASARAARARGPPGTPTRAGMSSRVFGHSSSLSAATPSPRRPSGSRLTSPIGVSTRRSSAADISAATAATGTLGGAKRIKTGNGALNPSLTNISNNMPGNAGTSSSVNNIINNINISNNNNNNNSNNNHSSTDSARNIANQSTPTSSKIASDNIPSIAQWGPDGHISGSSSIMRSPGLKSPSKKRVYDRFIPVREGGLSEHYELLPDAPSTPSRQRSRNMSMTPNHASQVADHYKKAQNQAHDTVIANELMLSNTTSTYENRFPSTPRRLFAFASTTTHNTLHFDSPSRQIYAPTPVSQESRSILLSPKKAPRTISKFPFKVLDAPELRDDFYLNLVDWSSQNVLGVGLGSCVYLWSALTTKVTQLCDLGENDNVTSISWISMGTHLAVGTDSGTIQIWDVRTSQRVRIMTGHTQRVGVLAWNDHVLTSGSRDRNIYTRDVRSHGMWQQQLSSHTGEVCGLKWNSAGTQLASGGNDNRLMVWERDAIVPLYKFRDHNAAVKAIDWNPHQSGILASGGGTADRHIRFWNTTTGVSVGATDTGSQVCNLAWSKTTNELVSTHGYSQNQVVLWKYPSMQQIAALSGHQLRVLYLALSPDGQTIVTGAGDETLRFWNVFQKSKAERRDDDGLTSVVATIR